MTKRLKVDVITLGCSKNLVDSERLLKILSDSGMDVRHDPTEKEQADSPTDIVVVNTCGFIGDAKEESINTILHYVDRKNSGKIKRLYVMGCLSGRYAAVLPTEIPEVDKWYGKTDWHFLVKDLVSKYPATVAYDRIITTPRHHAFLKVSEGCNRFCAFCAIPLITGRYRSRDSREIVDEVKMLTARGVKEFNVIAQDLSAYGTDTDSDKGLADLISRISDVKGVEWIRLHYAYPAGFPTDLLPVMAQRDNVCKYLDIALQHSSDRILRRMRRHIDRKGTEDLIARIREEVPGIHLRTTMMTGFPGETQEDFEDLLDFVGKQRFERLGAFAYCEEEDTFAALNYRDDVPQQVKEERLSKLMALQEDISFEIQQEKVGRRLKVMVDRKDNDFFIGRTQWDSPEVDPEVLIYPDPQIEVGNFTEVEVLEALPFELIARKAD